MKKYFLIFALFTVGCASAPETIIKQVTVEIPVPEIKDSMATEMNLPEETIENLIKNLPEDYVIAEGKRITFDSTGRETHITIRAKKKTIDNKPKLEFEYSIKQDPVKKEILDTTKKFEKVIVNNPPDSFLEKTGKWFWYVIGILTLVIGVLGILKWKKIV